MKLMILIGICLIAGAGLWYYLSTADFFEPSLIGLKSPAASSAPTNASTDTAATVSPEPTAASDIPPTTNAVVTPPPEFVTPLDRTDERITKKPFGILINPATSPVQPERFAGYHTGVDFEILAGEEDTDVMVKAFCRGALMAARTVNGYGGVVIQTCTVEGATVTALYGHLDIQTIIPKIGDRLNPGDNLAVLGDGYTSETDGERKHLHFSLHTGNSIEYRGYVSSKPALSAWIDPLDYF